MLFVIFPKLFEFHHFVNSFKENIFDIINFKIKDQIMYIVLFGFELGIIDCAFIIKIIHDSDIGFNIKFNEFISVLKQTYMEEYNSFEFLLIGSCGSFGESKLNDVYFITDAIKYDRGSLVGERVFMPEKDKLQRIKLDKLSGYTILTGNQLFNLNKDNGNVIFNIIKDKYRDIFDQPRIVEMEVYDFFIICQHQNIKTIGALKIVSDLCGTNSKDPRVLYFNMQKLIPNFLEVIKKYKKPKLYITKGKSRF